MGSSGFQRNVPLFSLINVAISQSSDTLGNNLVYNHSISPVRKTETTVCSSNRKGFNSKKWLQRCWEGQRKKEGMLPRVEKAATTVLRLEPCSCICCQRLLGSRAGTPPPQNGHPVARAESAVETPLPLVPVLKWLLLFSRQ